MEGHPAIPSHTWEISRRRVVFFGGRAAAPRADGLAVKSRRLRDAAAKGAAPRSRSREGTPDAITMAPGTRTLLVALGFLSPLMTTFVVNRSGSDAEAEQSQSQHTWSLEIEIRSVPCVTAARAAMHRDSLAGAAVLSYCCSALPLLALQRAARGPVGATHIIK